MNYFTQRGLEASEFGKMMKRGRKIGKRRRTFYAAMVGTFICFVSFVRHYIHANDETVVRVWFGKRSDGRCGRDFGTEVIKETTCGDGLCCSSHGWCGFGEDYCSVALGCQSGCTPVDEAEQKRIDEQKQRDPEHQEGMVDDDDYSHYRRHYRYDDDPEYRHYRHHDPYHDHPDDEYHHRYDEDPDYNTDELDEIEHHPEQNPEPETEHHGEGHGEHAIENEDAKDEGVELVGLHEKHHLGEGDNVPLQNGGA
mmetsp:Transcript_15228/g.25434  ORF Transcript_15228/g.25434 Transcript_15228/m.25434 type:complete len:253 (-) Transcript_15228:200-958(-)